MFDWIRNLVKLIEEVLTEIGGLCTEAFKTSKVSYA